MPVLVGREAPLALLDRWRSEAAAGSGRLVLITGDAGIGKTTLAEETLARAGSAGFVTARTHTTADPGAPSLWPWQRLGRVLPGLDRLLDPERVDPAAGPVERFGAFEAVSAYLAATAAEHGLAVMIDDLHWADSSTLRLLRHVAADLSATRLLLIATARQHGATAWTASAAELRRAAGARVIALDGLDQRAIEAWLRSSPELAGWLPEISRITAMTRGNPFYIGLLTSARPAAGVTGHRADVAQEVRARLAALSQLARDCIETAAVADNLASVQLLAAASGETEPATIAAVDELQAAGFLRDGDTVEFTHALVRDAVIAALPPGRREHLHASIARGLESRHDPSLAGSIAEHWRQVTGPDAADSFVTWARRAATIAAQRYDPERAAGYLRAVLDSPAEHHIAAGQRAELAVELARVVFQSGDMVQAVDACRAAADLAQQADRPDLAADAALVIRGMGDWDVARTVVELCERALQAVTDSDLVHRARLLAQLSAALTETVDPVRGAALSVEALRLAEATGDPTAQLEAIAARHLAITTPSTVDERVRLARRAIDIGATVATPTERLWGHLWLLMALYQLGDLDGAMDQAEEVRLIADQYHSPIARWHHYRIQAAFAALVGDFDRAALHSADALRLAERIGDSSMIGIHHAFTLFLGITRGDPGTVNDDTIALFKSGPRIALLRVLLVAALILRGEHDEAAALFEELRHLPSELAQGVRWAGTVGQIGMAAAALGDTDVAEQVHRLMSGMGGPYDGDGSGFIVASGATDRLRADVALAAGHVQEAVERYADAVIANVRIGARPFVALARLGWAKALLARWQTPAMESEPGDLTAASSLAAQAASEFRRLHMPGHLDSADRLLAEIATARRRDDPLTGREREVAVLLAQGHKNKEIAAELVLSERTVETHVSSILAKLNLSSRIDVANWFADRRETPTDRR